MDPEITPKSSATASQAAPGQLSTPIVAALLCLTMGILTLIQEPVNAAWLAWAALIPWTLAALLARSPRGLYILNYALGLLYFTGNLYWLIHVTLAGYIALCFYMAWYFPVWALILRRLYRRWPIPLALLLPLLWVAQEYLRAIIMTGFPWLFLSHSQHEYHRLMQICDLFGAYTLTALIAFINGAVADVILWRLHHPGPLRWRLWTPAAATACLLAAALTYGQARINETLHTARPGPMVTVIQDVIPQYVRGREMTTAEIFERHFELTQKALAAQPQPELIVWPETMTAPLNHELLALLAPHEPSAVQDRRLRALAAEHNVALLIGSPAVKYAPVGGHYEVVNKWNAALLYLPDSGFVLQRYFKMHLVPFGEVVPFRQSWPWLYHVLNNLTPYDYEYTLDPGEEATVFRLPTTDGEHRFAVPICYEDVMPPVVRRLAAPQDGRKRVDFLLNISNDGWFVRPEPDGGVRATTELLQHWVICKFRAVENRIGIARAVNTGVSGFIDSTGRSHGAPLAGSLSSDPRRRQTVSGFLTDRIVLDDRVTLYARIGDVFAQACTLLVAAGFIITLVNRRRRPR